MELRYSPEVEEFRSKVRDFLTENLPAGWTGMGALQGAERAAFIRSWRTVLHEHGFLAVSWPEEYGGPGLSAAEAVVLAEELTRADAPRGGPNDVYGIALLGNSILHWGSDVQKRELLPRILDGTDVWCQGYSEPNAGSDLANISCRAELEDGRWVINGQKVWTTNAHLANKIYLLVRTSTETSRHRGLTFLLCSLDQPGVEIRPIKMLSGDSEFNEVYFTNAFAPEDSIVGGVGNGWAVAMTLLGHERGAGAAAIPILLAAELRRVRRLAADVGRDRDPLIRQQLADCHIRVEVMRFLGYRALTSFLAGQVPGPAGSVAKLGQSEYHQRLTALAIRLLGASATTPSGRRTPNSIGADDATAPNTSASWVDTFYASRAGTIYGGTSEVQRNILAEQVLGLPKEPATPTHQQNNNQGTPWRQSPKADSLSVSTSRGTARPTTHRATSSSA